MSASLAHDDRLADGLAATVAGFPLRCRARTIGALIALDPVPSGQTRAFLAMYRVKDKGKNGVLLATQSVI